MSQTLFDKTMLIEALAKRMLHYAQLGEWSEVSSLRRQSQGLVDQLRELRRATVLSLTEARRVAEAQVRILCLDGKIRELEDAGAACVNAWLRPSLSAFEARGQE